MASRPKKPALCALSRIVVRAKLSRPRGAGLALLSTIANLAGNASAADAAGAGGAATVTALPLPMVVSTPSCAEPPETDPPARRSAQLFVGVRLPAQPVGAARNRCLIDPLRGHRAEIVDVAIQHNGRGAAVVVRREGRRQADPVEARRHLVAHLLERLLDVGTGDAAHLVGSDHGFAHQECRADATNVVCGPIFLATRIGDLGHLPYQLHAGRVASPSSNTHDINYAISGVASLLRGLLVPAVNVGQELSGHTFGRASLHQRDVGLGCIGEESEVGARLFQRLTLSRKVARRKRIANRREDLETQIPGIIDAGGLR